MAEIRLNKIIRTYNIGLQNLVDFLSSKGVEVEANPNAKISDEHLPAIEKQFGKDLELKQASEKVDIKLNEILEKTSRKQQESAKEEEYEPVRETVIKTTIFTPVEPKPEPETIRPVVPEPQPEIKPEPQPEPVVETPVAETVKEPEPQPEVKPEPAERPVEETPAEKPKAEVTESKPEPQPEVKKVETAKETVPEPTTPAAGKDIRGGERPMSKHEKKLAAAARQKEEQAKAKHQQHPEGKPERNEEKPATESSTPGLKVLGKIDLSQFEPKKGNKKRERIAKGSQKVDVAKEGKQADNSSRKDKN